MTGEHLEQCYQSSPAKLCATSNRGETKTSPTAPINTSKETNKHAAMHNRACKRITSKGLC